MAKLKFKLFDTLCEIKDDYSIMCVGNKSEKIEKLWKNLTKNEKKPSEPCPIDEMHDIVETLKANILEYEQEADPDLVY